MGTANYSHTNSIPKYQVLANWLETRILDGRLPSNSILPSIRQLARQHQLAKNTVISALHCLEARSLVEALPKVGYRVKARCRSKSHVPGTFDTIQPSSVNLPSLFQDIMVRGAAFDIKPSDVSEPTPALLSQLYKNIHNRSKTQMFKKSLYYDDPTGDCGLRAQISQHYQSRSLFLNIDEICITNGCQHALFLALMTTCKKGDNVIIESPGFYGVIQLLDQLGLNAIEVPTSYNDGIDIGAIQTALSHYTVAACVLSPAFSTPSGTCISDEQKKSLVLLANQYDVALIEDDIYGDLSFVQTPLPLKAFDDSGTVILCSSFSKSLSRDLRTGWIMGGRWHKEITRLKLINSMSNSQAVQQGIRLFMQDGNYKRFIRQRTAQLLSNRNQLTQVLQDIWQEQIFFSVPDGGLSLWAAMPKCKNTLTLYQNALKDDIVITPGAMFTVEQDYSQCLRLSFCHPVTESRKKALQILYKLSQKSTIDGS